MTTLLMALCLHRLIGSVVCVCMQALQEKWEAEREALAAVQRLKEEVQRVEVEVQQAERAADLGRAAELKYGMLPRLRNQLAAAEAALASREVRPTP